ncbi:MAG: argininosuccinate lyase [Candidatus Melainabacteria bacterium]|nr:argininosuccinate lyase [Candidatus Melainabacteria bacterium]
MNRSNDKKLWSGRFKEETALLLDQFNSSLSFDKRLYKQDIACSIAYAKMLAHSRIISKQESEEIIRGLAKIYEEIEIEKNKWFEENKNEDIHSAIECRLINIIGEVAKKLHTGRSRNDQIATDIRLWLKEEVKEIINLLKKLRSILIQLARNYYNTIILGYTHLQPAQPITLGHYLLSYEQKILRDIERFKENLNRIDILPLGSGALSGTSFPIDRNFLVKELGFKALSENSMDAVSDRDFLAECLFNISLLGIHLSQFSEELILWNSEEFKYIAISDSYATGSSMMPNKKNPDVPELIRGKAGRFLGNLVSMLTVLKGLPQAYNKDLQEDKERIFDSVDNIKIVLQIADEFLQNINFNKEKMYETANSGFVSATDVADYLTKKGIPFRVAHEVVGKIVAYCIERKRQFKDLSMSEWNSFHRSFNDDIIEKIKIESCVESKNIYGGTSPMQVLKAIERAERRNS